MSASKEHDLIVALVTRFIVEQGFEVVALESSLGWLFGDSFKFPPAITLHRPDVLGVRRDPPFVCIGEAKTCGDLHSARTHRQLIDFSEARVGDTGLVCQTVIGIPQDCEATLRKQLAKLRIRSGRIRIVCVPRALLARQRR
jgi:hypothetical protein